MTFVILLAITALAQNQDSQGTGTSIYSCTIIDKPGPYVLTKNITATQKDLKRIMADRMPACIVIASDFVSLDLQGYTIKGPGAGDNSGAGIYVAADASGWDRFETRIRNGVVTSFNPGISVEGSGHTIERVRLYSNGPAIVLSGEGHKVKEAVVYFNGPGIACNYGMGSSVEHSRVYHNDSHGINMAACPGCSIIGNTVFSNGADGTYGIFAQCPSVIVQNMSFDNPIGVGGRDIVIEGPAPWMCTKSDNSPPW